MAQQQIRDVLGACSSFPIFLPTGNSRSKKRKWCLTNSTKKKKNLSGGPLSLKIGNELFKLRKQEFPAKVHQSVGLAQAHPFEQKNRVIKILKKKAILTEPNWLETVRVDSVLFFVLWKKKEPNKKKYKNKFDVFGSLLI